MDSSINVALYCIDLDDWRIYIYSQHRRYPHYQFLRRYVLENMNASFVVFACLIVAIIPSAMVQLVPSNQPCTAEGYFEIVDGTCRNYYICIFNGAAIVSYDLTCVTPTLFDPTMGICVTGYTCTQSTPVTACTISGKYPISGTACKQYHVCLIYQGIVINRYLTCQNSTIFNPTNQACVLPSSYKCPS
ncbi:uncharacterized protein LOC117222817 [Megalopta genalis]|uniref:uncharacterized protein LOC117222817 n=1 Tax=Megalopta genalis TaxID=115081 RepID=UPI003FD4E8C1